MTSKLISTTAAAAGLLAVLAPGALASTATISSANRVNVTAAGSQKNQIRVSYDSGSDLYTITDAGGIDGSGACLDVDANTATCPGAGIASVTVNSGAGDDTIALDRPSRPLAIEGDLARRAASGRLRGR